MSARKVTRITSIILILISLSLVLTGCSRPQYDKTISAYVMVKEIDDIELDNEFIESFMSQYYENSNIEFTSKKVDEDDGQITVFTVSDRDRDNSVVHNDDFGVCYEYETVEQAKEDYNNYYFPNFSMVGYMQSFAVRVGKYVFFTGADLWKPLFDEIGIPLEKKNYHVADPENVVYERIEYHDLDEIIKALKKMNYSVNKDHMFYIIVSSNGDETYTIIDSKEDSKEFRKNRKDLKSYWFTSGSHGIMTSDGLTVYGTNKYVVISRGNSWRELLERITEQ